MFFVFHPLLPTRSSGPQKMRERAQVKIFKKTHTEKNAHPEYEQGSSEEEKHERHHKTEYAFRPARTPRTGLPQMKKRLCWASPHTFSHDRRALSSIYIGTQHNAQRTYIRSRPIGRDFDSYRDAASAALPDNRDRRLLRVEVPGG